MITVCIVHFRRLAQLQRTVEALEQHTCHPYRLSILNQGFVDDDIEAFLRTLSRQEHVGVTFGQDNIGCSPGRRLLASQVTTPLTMMLDDDMLVSDNWDVPVIQKFSEEPDLGAMGFCLYHTDGTFWQIGGRMLAQRRKVIRFDWPPARLAMSGASFVDVDCVCGGAMVYRTALSSQCAWDPAMFIGFEDFDMGIRLKHQGVRSVISLHSRFIHDKVSHDWRQAEYNRFRRDYQRIRASYLHLCQKHDCRFDLARDTFYRYVCLLPNAIVRPMAYLWLNLRRTT